MAPADDYAKGAPPTEAPADDVIFDLVGGGVHDASGGGGGGTEPPPPPPPPPPSDDDTMEELADEPVVVGAVPNGNEPPPGDGDADAVTFRFSAAQEADRLELAEVEPTGVVETGGVADGTEAAIGDADSIFGGVEDFDTW